MTISARRHEARLLWASRPSLALLLHAARFAQPIVRVPRLGWLVRDPVLCREIRGGHRHFTLLGEGGVGHLWAQVLGDYVTELFDGPGHLRLRTRARDLFTTKTSADLVAEAFDEPLDALTTRLRAGEHVDIADACRVLVGRISRRRTLLARTAAFGTVRPGNRGPGYLGPYVMTPGCNMAISAELYVRAGGFPRTRIQDLHEDRALVNAVRRVTTRYGRRNDVVVSGSSRRVRAWGLVRTLAWYADHRYRPSLVDIR